MSQVSIEVTYNLRERNLNKVLVIDTCWPYGKHSCELCQGIFFRKCYWHSGHFPKKSVFSFR